MAASSADAPCGGEAAQASFGVPSESATATTVKVTVNLPLTSQFGEVLVRSMPGWTVSTTHTKQPATVKVGGFTCDRAATAATWSAQAGSAIAVGQFQDFEILIGPLPDRPCVQFTADQFYSDGSVVKWDQPTPAAAIEPGHPAAGLLLAPAPSPGSVRLTSAGSGPAVTAASPTISAVANLTDSCARELGKTARAIGILSLPESATGVVLVWRRPRSTA
jgi:uncharacterized protein YcnI